MMTPAELNPTVTVVPGDGIGPEVVNAARRVIDATGVGIDWDVQEAGIEVREREGTPLPERVVDSIQRSGVALKGPLATDAVYGSPSVALREALDLHTTIRPCRSGAGSHEEVDIVVVKMNHEDLYARIGFGVGEPATAELRELIRRVGCQPLAADAAASVRPLSASEARRVIRAAFDYARANRRERVTAVHKAPLIPQTDGLFLEIAREVGEAYPDLTVDDALVDTVCERLISRPAAYDVMVMPRMYGDIVSGLGAAVIGGPGMAPGVNIGEGRAVFEAAHGTAPHRAGRNQANPLAMILTGALLLRHLGESGAADRVEAAVGIVVREGRTLTYDLAPAGAAPASTEGVTDAVIAALGSPTA